MLNEPLPKVVALWDGSVLALRVSEAAGHPGQGVGPADLVLLSPSLLAVLLQSDPDTSLGLLCDDGGIP